MDVDTYDTFTGCKNNILKVVHSQEAFCAELDRTDRKHYEMIFYMICMGEELVNYIPLASSYFTQRGIKLKLDRYLPDILHDSALNFRGDEKDKCHFLINCVFDVVDMRTITVDGEQLDKFVVDNSFYDILDVLISRHDYTPTIEIYRSLQESVRVLDLLREKMLDRLEIRPQRQSGSLKRSRYDID